MTFFPSITRNLKYRYFVRLQATLIDFGFNGIALKSEFGWLTFRITNDVFDACSFELSIVNVVLSFSPRMKIVPYLKQIYIGCFLNIYAAL